MSKAHKVESGDTLGAISIKYLGSFSNWKKIIAANPQLAGRKTAPDGSPLIFPGDILVIPDEDKSEVPPAPQTKTITLSGDAADVSIVIDGYEFKGFTAYEINLNYDCLDSFSFTAPLDIASKEIAEALEPFAFKTCDIYYEGELLLKGTLLTPDPQLTGEATEINFQGYPLCGILNDCTIPLAEYPAEYSDLDIKEIAVPIGESLGITVLFEGNTGEPFTKVSIEPTEKILDFLVKLSKQRDLIFTNDEKGRLLFFKHKDKKAFANFEQGKKPLLEIRPKFKAQEFFSHIIGFSKSDADHECEQFIYENQYLIGKGITRCKTIIVDDAEESDLEASVKAYAGRMFADCVSFELDCHGHKNADKKVFKKGMTVCVKAPGAMIRKETNFIAKNIKLKRDTSGNSTTMTLILPGSYSGDIPGVMPWE